MPSSILPPTSSNFAVKKPKPVVATSSIKKLLVANRGEIACRIIKTAKAMGMTTVALYSDADSNARHVELADEAYYLGGSAPNDSYLKTDLIIHIAKQANAQAIHPGYGFLSENATFARSCEQNGIIFVGPSADAIESMGSKSAAKDIMTDAHVPLVPGYHGENQDDAFLIEHAIDMGFPLLIKAAYGGGGKGMRIVEDPSQIAQGIKSARREASSAFGNDKLLIERYLRQPRHVEVQVFADMYGKCIYLSDRDCSIQRRYQKVVEEAPAPGLSDELRQKMGQAAVAAAKAINYCGAGTVEFLLDTDEQFYFMEMNTRLQVEHPVTEMVTGQDLVKWQLLIASGEKLPLAQSQVQISGHAFEARIYAEDPYNDFLPSSGQLIFLREPQCNQHVRIDTGVRENDVISNFYDPMISKLITWDESRPQALRRLEQALTTYQIGGLKHNIDFLTQIIQHPAFASADFSTDFIERYADDLVLQHGENTHVLAFAALYQVCRQKQQMPRLNHRQDPHSPWGNASSFRLNQPRQHQVVLLDDAQQKQHFCLKETQRNQGTFYQLTLDGIDLTLSGELVGDVLTAELGYTLDENTTFAFKKRINVSHIDDDFSLFFDSKHYHFQAIQIELPAEIENLADKLKAPMNGTIVTHLVKPGDTVQAGQGLMVMEAMKMEYTIAAPFDGVVSEFYFKAGELVSDGTLLLDIAPMSPTVEEV